MRADPKKQNLKFDTSTPRHLSTSTPQQLLTQHLSNCLSTSAPRHLSTSAPRQLPTNLNIKQIAILQYIYFNRPFRIKGDKGISSLLNLPYGTVRSSLESLSKKTYISKPYAINDGSKKYSTCRVNEELCIKLFGPTAIINPEKKSDDWTPQHLSTSAPQHLGTSAPRHFGTSLNSSSSYTKTTTIQNCPSDTEQIITEIMTTDPEYTYWIEQQVTPAQASTWQQEFGLDLQTILNNLCYVRWQILNQDTKITKSPADYVYGIMKKTGGTVNKPSGYKSVAQKDLEYYESWKNQQIEHAQKIEQLKAEALKAKIAPKVAAILKKPDLENEHLEAALELIKAKKRRQAIVIMIKAGKPLDESSKSTLKMYLEQVLSQDASALE